MLSFLLSFVILISGTFNNDDSFEGSIEIVHSSFYDISYFTYIIKDSNVRIDKFDNNNDLIQSMLIDLDKDQIFVLSHEKKLYTLLEPNTEVSDQEGNFFILKTENSREVNGYECYQWRVKNIDRNTEVAYWVWQNNFYFFEELVHLLHRTDKTYEFFEKIPETQGFFPMLAVERTLLRKEKSRVCVLNINKKSVNESVFKIPSDFDIVKH
ncbi:MAG: DUF4412 domain-containing protein [Bacteroidales bacterium]|nr:DUF4412 domain-containing protein [Bacteroidales bacterium]